MAPEITFVLVHYRTPGRLREAVAEAQIELERCSENHGIVVVDNSGDIDPGLESERCTVLRPGSNLGYAAAANLAVRHATGTMTASVVNDRRYFVLSNPDVTMLPGCLEQLMGHCPGGGAAGPSLFWEGELRLRLPPTETFESEFSTRVLARVSPLAAARDQRRHWRRHARRHWQAKGPLATRHLSGAFLLFDAAALERVGPLDENFRLYFEETDWLRRAQTLGVKTALVPTAVAVHDYDQSASLEPAASDWFASSEALFRRRYRLPRAPLATVEQARPVPLWSGEIEIPGGCRELWFEVSSSVTGIPAAAERIPRDRLVRAMTDSRAAWQPPAAVAHRTEGWWLAVSDQDRRELGRFRL